MRRWNWIHRWFSLVFGLLLVMWAASGIVLNHRGLVSGLDVPRHWLPANYTPKNWNLATIRSAIKDQHGWLVWGNIGIWQADSTFARWRPFMEGIPRGMDNRRTMRVIRTPDGRLFAAAQSGLFECTDGQKWAKIELPLHDERIVDISEKDGIIYVVGRSEVFVAQPDDKERTFERVELPPAKDEDGKTSLFRTLWVLHSGEILGQAGKLVVDLFGLLMIFFVATGYIYFFFPGLIRKLKRAGRKTAALVQTNRFSIKWHNKLGIWLGTFLIFTSLTGMFLRPPLLIAIAGSRINKIKGTMLDHPNPWFDKLRAVRSSHDGSYFIIVSNEGIYYTTDLVRDQPVPFYATPPLSVMGINVLEQLQDHDWLVGSFNGLFIWNALSGSVVDYFTGKAQVGQSDVSSPVGDHMVAGYIPLGDDDLIFDYNGGLSSGDMPMPEEIARQPFPLWNFALEVHTGRIFQQWIGPFYILLVPLMGIFSLLILISGMVIYLKRKFMKNDSK